MATTTNYGWDTPDDTDLVKDGAAAIRTLGNSADTTVKNLNPETTLGDIAYRSATANTNTRLPIGSNGQILGVSGGVPAWINNDQGDITEVQAGTGISVASGTGPIPVVTNTVATAYDAKGDLVVGTGADTFAKLSVVTNGHTLVCDSAETTGLKWAAASSDSYTQIASVSLTGAQTDITTISGSYKRLILVVRDFYVSGAGDNLVLRFNNSSTANSYHQSGVTRAGAIFNGGSFLWATYNTNVGSNQSNMFWMEIEDYANTATWKVASAFNGYYDGSNDQSEMFVYNWENTSAITEINLLATGGNLSGGTAILYGVK
jgi:hypothetical protein